MKNLLVIVDFQNDFINGSLGFEKAKSLEPIILEKYEKYLKNNDDIIFTFDLHYDNYLDTLEGQKLPIKHCINETYGAKAYKKFDDLAKNHLCFYKNTFGSLELGNYLANKDYANIEIVGLVSNICVLSNAIIIKAAKPNTRIFIDKNATASCDEDLHNKALDILKNLHIDII